jgi:hypothetical protein
MSELIEVEVAGEGRWSVPADAVARDRAAYLARQASGAGPEAGNDLYNSVFASEYAFALDRPDLLQAWAAHHMERAALLSFKPPAAAEPA